MGKLLWTPKNRKISHIFIGMDINSIVCYRGYDNRAGLILVKEKKTASPQQASRLCQFEN